MDEDVTEVVRRHQAQHSSMNKTLAVLLGLVGALAPAVTGYLAYRQAKIESGVETVKVRGEAAVGYRTVADPLALMQDVLREHDWKIQRLEQRCAEKPASFTPALTVPPPTLIPLDRMRLFRPLPRTLGDAAALAK